MEADSKRPIKRFTNKTISLHFKVETSGSTDHAYDIYQSADNINWRLVHTCNTLKEVEEYESHVTGIYLNQLNFLSDIIGGKK